MTSFIVTIHTYIHTSIDTAFDIYIYALMARARARMCVCARIQEWRADELSSSETMRSSAIEILSLLGPILRAFSLAIQAYEYR